MTPASIFTASQLAAALGRAPRLIRRVMARVRTDGDVNGDRKPFGDFP